MDWNLLSKKCQSKGLCSTSVGTQLPPHCRRYWQQTATKPNNNRWQITGGTRHQVPFTLGDFVHPIYISESRLNIKTPLSITQYSSIAPQTTASKLTIWLNQRLSKTASAKTEHYKRHEGSIYCRTVVLDCINSYQAACQQGFYEEYFWAPSSSTSSQSSQLANVSEHYRLSSLSCVC